MERYEKGVLWINWEAMIYQMTTANAVGSIIVGKWELAEADKSIYGVFFSLSTSFQ